MILTRELTAWGLDEYEFRAAGVDQEKMLAASDLVGRREASAQGSPICEGETRLLEPELALQRVRADLRTEMHGLSWSLGVTDLRYLLAFQRRLSFYPEAPVPTARASDWSSLIEVAFGPPRAAVYEVDHESSHGGTLVHSDDPNLHVRINGADNIPFALRTSGPFFEVARYNDRWFLRDGYHRAYKLLQDGIFKIPSVIVYARTLSELGADHPWFFPEYVLFSDHAPRVTDFLDDAVTIEYHRPRMRKTIRFRFEESFSIIPSGEYP